MEGLPSAGLLANRLVRLVLPFFRAHADWLYRAEKALSLAGCMAPAGMTVEARRYRRFLKRHLVW